MEIINKYIVYQTPKVTREDRQKLNNHKSYVLWFTGLPGSGKTTLSMEIERKLYEYSIHCFLLDGDNIRHGLNKDLGFSQLERQENIRRLGEVARLFLEAGLFTLVSSVSPYSADRNFVRSLFAPGEFIEIYVSCSQEECERRDPKGFYKRAKAGVIPYFTGVSAPYEKPKNPEITVDTEQQSISESVTLIFEYLRQKNNIMY